MKLEILFKTGLVQIFDEKEINCKERTIKGHAYHLIDAWRKHGDEESVYCLDRYTAISLNQVFSVRVYE